MDYFKERYELLEMVFLRPWQNNLKSTNIPIFTGAKNTGREAKERLFGVVCLQLSL